MENNKEAQWGFVLQESECLRWLRDLISVVPFAQMKNVVKETCVDAGVGAARDDCTCCFEGVTLQG